ncbi:MAG TPA: 4Fe-4S dicluster domain-containing protein [candidate division Zixibacteria bacterium]|nr:4Fe-4S dicluster domain-containing protein [candidate division Zixibacteria bacterium]
MNNRKALLIDTNLCVGCQACVEACKEENNQPDVETFDLSSTSYTAVIDKGDVYLRRMCMHCEVPTCVSVCPVGALQKTELGPVIYDAEKCIGCRYCMQACPYGVPTYEWNTTNPKIQKCTMCYSRQKVGKIPACAEACPAEATIFGDRDELLAVARKRMIDEPETYVDHIFGEHEAGGTSVLFISSVPFKELGFPMNLPGEPLPDLTWNVISKIPRFSVFFGSFLYGVWWVIDRRMEIADKENDVGNKENKIVWNQTQRKDQV